MRPYIVEFTGTPEAGKTTCIMKIISILKSHGFNIGFVQESAEITPNCIPKGSWHSNVWMRCTTIAKTLEMAYSPQYDIIICDRGPLDGIFFGYKYLSEGKCSVKEVQSYLEFLQDSKIWPDFLIAVTTTPEESIRRRGGEGRLVTKKWVEDYNRLLIPFYNDMSVDKTLIDTTDRTREQVTNQLVEIIEKKFWDYKHKNQ